MEVETQRALLNFWLPFLNFLHKDLHLHQYDQMACGRLSCVTRDSGGSVRLLPNGGMCSCCYYLLLVVPGSTCFVLESKPL